MALTRTIEAERWPIAEGSAHEGRLTTGFMRLDPAEIPKATKPKPGDAPIQWAAAEYRYRVLLGRGTGATTTRVRAEIRAWPSVDAGGAGAAHPVTLKSSGHLEHEYLRAFARQMEGLTHLFPPDEGESTE